MRLYFIPVIIMLLAGCTKTGPISGNYQTNDGKISAVVIDSSLYLMIGLDTMFIYDLKYNYTVEYSDTFTVRMYQVLYYHSLNRSGYEHFEIPIKLEGDDLCGGTLTANFTNDDSFSFGGYYFAKQRNERAKVIFENWKDLLFGNQETEMRLKYQKE